MENKKPSPLEVMQAYTGKEFSISPSPFTVWLKPVIVSAERGRIACSYIVRKEMTNPMATLHGGITAGIIDDIIGAVMYSLEEEYFYTTINNVIDYFAPAFEQDVVIAEAFIVKKGSQIINVQCDVWNQGKTRLIARGTSNLLKTNIKKQKHA